MKANKFILEITDEWYEIKMREISRKLHSICYNYAVKPEIVYVDAISYKKLQLVHKQRTLSYEHYYDNYDDDGKEIVFGMELKSLPIEEETVILAFEDNEDNFSYAIRSVE